MMWRGVHRWSISLGVWMAVSAVACGSQRDASAPMRRSIAELPAGRVLNLTDSTLRIGGSDTLRFGRLHSGEIATLQFWVANRSSQPVVLADYECSCGCTTLEYDSYPIHPGEAQSVECVFDSRGEFGWQFKRMDLTLSGSAHPWRIFVEVDVR